MDKRMIIKALFASGTLVVSGLVGANQYNNAADIPLGAFSFTPTVDVEFGYDDNVTSSETDIIGSSYNFVAPQFNLSSEVGTSVFTLGYRLVNESYFSSSQDDATDHFLSGRAELSLNAYNKLVVSLGYEDGHDDRGTVFTLGTGSDVEEPDQFKQSQFDTMYTYGSAGADGRIEMSLNIRELDYDREDIDYQVRDRTISTLGGTFYYRIGQNTDATFDLQYATVDYKVARDPANPLDSGTTTALLGVSWEATALTSGYAKLGYEKKEFDVGTREGFSGADWALGVIYEPNIRSEIEFSSSTNTNETNGDGNFIRSQTHRVQWRHDWLERVRTSTSLMYRNEKYEGVTSSDGVASREDDTVSASARAYYQFRRWFNVELGYTFSKRNSNRDLINFDRNQVHLNFFITL